MDKKRLVEDSKQKAKIIEECKIKREEQDGIILFKTQKI